ncbi:hypothetical protein Bca52824_023742 [Brassica carinata]|uniref:Uncharacterized protein n=1 Tax=Brassica carinata TaxID=52824 RepID=A0A8X7VIV7_BRACI|nr:hypothetical protein Bca52824_023742 [Brassica carinata]
MSKRSGSSVPLTAERLGSRRRTNSPVSKSGSSSDPHDESGHRSLALAPLSYASPIPPLVDPTLSVGEKDLEEWRKSYSLPSSVRGPILLALRARATLLELDSRQMAHLISSEVLRRSRLWDGMAKGYKEDLITAFKRAADALSAIRGITGGIVSDDEVVITGSRRRMMVKAEATSSSHGRKLSDRTTMRSPPQSSGAEQTPDGLSSVLADLNSKVFPRDQTLLSSDDPSEVIQTN